MAAFGGTLHIFEYNALVYRRIWRGTFVISVANPLIFLAGLGVGLGHLINGIHVLRVA